MSNTLRFSVKSMNENLVARCSSPIDAAVVINNYPAGSTVLLDGRVIYTLPGYLYSVDAIHQAIREAAGQWWVPKKRARAIAKVEGGEA